VGDAALKVPAEDAQAAGAALVRLSRDGALRAHLRELGRERAQLFSREVQARAMVAAFRSLLKV
jgi:glycosyltransferase involved in cell wall biosynthesis